LDHPYDNMNREGEHEKDPKKGAKTQENKGTLTSPEGKTFLVDPKKKGGGRERQG